MTMLSMKAICAADAKRRIICSATRRRCWSATFLYTRAFQLMVDSGSMRILEVMADATNIIAEGEVMQLMNIGNTDITEAQYVQVIQYKTAKLFEAAAQVGAILGNAAPRA